MTRFPCPTADAHAHIFPEKIAQKAADSIADFYKMTAGETGTLEHMLAAGDALGIVCSLVCSVATTPHQPARINDFIKATVESRPGRFVGFGTLHPGMTEAEMAAEALRIHALGLAGIKLHPDIQGFAVDDPHMLPLYRLAAELGLRVLLHCGDRRYHYSNPAQIAHVLDAVPGLTVLAAHFGGYSQYDEAFDTLRGYPQLFFDTSSSLPFISTEEAMRYIEGYGPARLMFGTDYPLWQMQDEAARFLALPLSDAQQRQILWDTFAGLFEAYL